MSSDRSRLNESLRGSLEALALPGDMALTRAPTGSARAEELALDYDNFLTAYRQRFATELTLQQLQALTQVNKLLSAMSGHANAELWTDEAVVVHERWKAVREAAGKAMSAMGWNVPVA
jgi:hypothetical protein